MADLRPYFTRADWRRLASQLAGFFLLLALAGWLIPVLDPPDRLTRPLPAPRPPLVDLLATDPPTACNPSP